MMNIRTARICSLFLVVGLMTGCCGRKFDTWELNGYYVEQDYAIKTTRSRTFSVENSGQFKGLKWLLLSCDRNEKITGMMGWTPDSQESGPGSTGGNTGNDAADSMTQVGNYERIVGTFDTRTGEIRIKDTAAFGQMNGIFDENRSITFSQKLEAAANVD